jgi:hypothetical protein
MATVKEVSERIDALFAEWSGGFTPLFFAVIEMRREMFIRIFGTGTSGGSNTAGQKLPTIAYSTEPIYVEASSLPKAPANFKFGVSTTKTKKGKPKKGKPIKSLYFPNGYAELKKAIGRPPLELTGFLKRSFATDQRSVFNEGFNSAVFIQEDEADKAEGLQYGNGKGFKGYGPIFQPTDEEQARMLELHAELLAEQIANQISK